MAGEASPNTYWNMGNTAVFFHNEKLVRRAETLVRGEPMMEDAVIQTGNELLGNYGLRQASLPQANLRKLGGYSKRAMGTYEPFSEGMAIVDNKFETDQDTLDKQSTGWLPQVLEDHRTGFKQSCSLQLIEGDAATPHSFDGLAVRRNTPDNGDGVYDQMNPDPATAAQRGVWDAGGTGSATTSIYAIQWGQNTKAALITPFNDPDYGIDEGPLLSVEESNPAAPTESRTILRKYFKRTFGFALFNDRALARIRNIPTALSDIATAQIVETMLYQMLGEWFEGNETVWLYVPPRIETILTIMMNEEQNVLMSRDNPYRMDIPAWAGRYPIRRCKAISQKETAVPAI